MCRLSFFPLIALLFAACNDGTVFHSYKSLPLEGWERRDTFCFDIPPTDRNFDGTLTIGLRTVAHVGTQEIVLAVEQADPEGNVRLCDTVRYPLTDAEGYALSKGVNTHQYEDRHLPLRLKKGKNTQIRIRHLMRHEVLSGITEIGIRIDKH